MYIFKSEYYRYVSLTLPDIVLGLMLILIVGIWASLYAKKKRESDPCYKFFVSGLIVRIIATIIFCILYITYYGGDTLDYFNSSVSLNHVGMQSVDFYSQIMFGGNDPKYFYFNADTGFPEWHIWKDPRTFFVVRLISPVCWLGLNSYLLSSIIMAVISYSGLWKLYRLLCSLYPKLIKYFAFSVLMFPSVLFWGSGLLKDTFTMAAAAWLTYCIFMVFFIKKKIVINILVALLMSYLIIKIKPYIFVSLFPGLLIWLLIKWILRIKNILVRALLVPVTLVFFMATIIFLFSSFGEYLGVYGNVDTMINKVTVTQSDLKRSEQYGTNYYDIGQIEATPRGLMAKAPAAITAGLFRPFIWEARNPFILISGFENLFLLFMVVFVMFKVGVKSYFGALFKDPFLTFSFLFSVFFAFGIGLAAANFGALVRYKIPLLPFFVSGMFIMLDLYRQKKAEREKELSPAQQ